MKSKEKALPSGDGGGVVADALTEILVRLPVKSVTKFKLVCKRWLSLISTDHFRRLHTLRCHKPPPSVILVANFRLHYFNPIIGSEKPTTMIPFTINLPNNPQIFIVSSCNGLLLLCSDYDCKALYVYNPTTKQSRKLSVPDNDKCIHVVQLHLVFDPSISIHYKIVCIRVDEDNGFGLTDRRTYQMEVFNSESGTWNVFREPFTNSNELGIDYILSSELNFGSAVHFSNKIYGITSFGDDYLYSFDIDRNALLYLPLPTPISYHSSQLLQVSDSCLYYVSLSDVKSAALWELRGNDEWMLKYHDGVPSLPGGHEARLLRFINMETSTILIHVQGKIMEYNFLDKSYKELVDLKSYSVFYTNVHWFAERTLSPV